MRDVLGKLKGQKLARIVIECKPKDKARDEISESRRLLEDFYRQSKDL